MKQVLSYSRQNVFVSTFHWLCFGFTCCNLSSNMIYSAVVAEWSNLPCFKFKKRQMVRPWVRIPLKAILQINIYVYKVLFYQCQWKREKRVTSIWSQPSAQCKGTTLSQMFYWKVMFFCNPTNDNHQPIRTENEIFNFFFQSLPQQLFHCL